MVAGTSPTTQAPTDIARRVQLVLGRVESLPTLGPIAAQLLKAGADDEIDIHEITTLIESDPALTAKILAMVRSAGRGVAHEITSVERAVTLLGLDALRALVLGVEIYDVMQDGASALEERDSDPPAFDRVAHWRFGVGVACAAENLARTNPSSGVKPEAAFVAGLLHSIGRQALEIILPKSYTRVIELARSRRTTAAAIERELIGTDHHTVGKRLAEHWGLPHALQDAAWLNGHPRQAIPDLPHASLIHVVRTAKAVCRSVNLGLSCDFDTPPIASRVAEEAGLNPQTADTCAKELHNRVADRCDGLGIDTPTSDEMIYESIAGANGQLVRLNIELARRERASIARADALQEITSFQHSDASTTHATAAAVARSAAKWFGASWVGVAIKSRETGPWNAFSMSSEGRSLAPEREALVTAPPPSGRVTLTADDAWSVSLFNRTKPTHAVMVEYTAGSESDHQTCCVLLTDRAPEPEREAHGGALRACWAAALKAATRHEGAKKLGEELAEAQRAIAEAGEKLAESESMARLGRVTAGAAHEMNNPLAIISGYTQILRDRLSSPELQRVARAIGKASHDVSELITSLNMLAEPPEPQRKTVVMTEVLKDAASRVSARTPGAGKLKLSMPEQMPLISVDRELLAASLCELLVNAAEAAPQQPIELRVQIDPVDDRLTLSVVDIGPGMSPDVEHHAFDPFFSAKPAGRGRGLGLSRAKSMVEAMSGNVSIRSEEGTGTTASIEFSTWRAKPAAETSNDSPTDTQTINAA